MEWCSTGSVTPRNNDVTPIRAPPVWQALRSNCSSSPACGATLPATAAVMPRQPPANQRDGWLQAPLAGQARAGAGIGACFRQHMGGGGGGAAGGGGPTLVVGNGSRGGGAGAGGGAATACISAPALAGGGAAAGREVTAMEEEAEEVVSCGSSGGGKAMLPDAAARRGQRQGLGQPRPRPPPPPHCELAVASGHCDLSPSRAAATAAGQCVTA